MRLTLELQEATEEKLLATRYGLVVLQESSALKIKHRHLEEEHESPKAELQQLKEIRTLQSPRFYLDISLFRFSLCLTLPSAHSTRIPVASGVTIRLTDFTILNSNHYTS